MEIKDRLQGAVDQVNDAEHFGEMAQSTREALSDKDFAIPGERLFPIQSAKQAMTALTYATWPDNKKHKDQVFKAVKKRWPKVWERFQGKGKRKGKRRGRTESIATLGDRADVRERLGAMRGLLADGQRLGGGKPQGVPGAQDDPNSIAAMFAQESEGLTEARRKGDPRRALKVWNDFLSKIAMSDDFPRERRRHLNPAQQATVDQFHGSLRQAHAALNNWVHQVSTGSWERGDR